MKLLHCILALVAFTLLGCSAHRPAPDSATAADGSLTVHAMASGNAEHVPQAVIYRTNGDYSRHVMVRLAPDRKAIASYPGIHDVSALSAPLPLPDGWWLDRQEGIGPGSAFLEYTFEQYSALDSQPSAATLLGLVIPGAEVTRCVTLPIPLYQALEHPDDLVKYIPKD